LIRLGLRRAYTFNVRNIADIRRLPVSERLELVAQIWDSILEDPGELGVSEDLGAELERRLESHRRSPDESEAWSVVERKVFEEE
jgi:putative addiction module component (TIGR02574 family)